MNSREYWQAREAAQLQHNLTEEAEYDRRLAKIYQDMLDACQKEIDSFYAKYASAEGITLAEAKKRVSKMDVAAYERKAARYVAEKNFSKRANDELRLYNATMQINRLELLKANIGLELLAGHAELESFMAEILQGRTMDELRRQAGILGERVKNNAKAARAIVNSSFHNATFSDRIWMYQDLLRNELSSLLQSGLIQGKNPRTLARELRKTFDAGISNTERLMRTELARVQTGAQKESFLRNGFTEYTFVVNGRCCDICKALDGKHFKVEDMEPGKNAPPMHPNCRCSTAAWEDSDEYEAWLDFLSKGGTTAEWNRLKDNSAVAKFRNSDKIKSRLTNIDQRAILDYMSAKSYIINEKLRNGTALSPEEQKFVNELDHALEKLPVYKGNLTRSLYFYLESEVTSFIEKHAVGTHVSYNEYISTTKGITYNPDGQVQICIQNAKRGKDISTINKGEEEVLYQRGSAFIVIDTVEHNGKHYILLEEDYE